MKKIFTAIIASIFLFGCEKNIIGDFEQTFVDSTEDAVNKKGVCYTNKSQRWSHKTSELNAHWMYSWGNVMREEIPENVEFVPMFWGKNSANDEAIINRVKGMIDEGKVKFVLGFNEPDAADQANMTVDQAIELWPKLEALGVPLVSPATKNPLNNWMKEFMQKAEENNLRIDYVGVHHYGGPNVGAFVDKLKQTYELYGKEIWITEFAVGDWNATSAANNRYSEEVVKSYMQELLPVLDDIDYIYRYSWFDGGQKPQLYTSGFYDENSEVLRPLGQAYADHKPNDIIGAGQDTEFEVPVDDGELIINGGFETGQKAPWGGFKNSVVTSDITAPKTGNFCGRMGANDASFVQVITVEPGTEYVLKFHSKWEEPVPNTFNAIIKNNKGDKAKIFTLDGMPKTDQWEETVFEFTTPANVTEIKVVIYKAKVNPTFPNFYLDDISLKVKE